LVVIAPVEVLTALLSSSIRSANSTGSSLTRVGANGQVQLNVNGGHIGTVIAGGLAIGLLSVVAGELASGASLKAVSEAYLGHHPDWRASLRFALSRLRSLIWLALVHAVVIVVGFVACIVPGVYFYGAFSVAVPVLLLEDVRGTKALGRSRRLVQGRWWSVAGAVLIGTLLTAVVQGAIAAVLTSASSSASNQVVTDIVSAIAGTVATTITTPFLAAVIVVLYIDLRVRKEGFDLELLAQRVGVEMPPGAAAPVFLPEPPPAPAGDGDEPPFWPPPPGWRPRGDQ